MNRLHLALLAVPLAGCHLFIELDGDDDVPFPIDAAVDGLDADPIPSDCDVELPCPAPNAGTTTVCGRLWDTELEQPLRGVGAAGSSCDAPTADGPCALAVRYFDALDFAQNPGAAPPLTAGRTFLDSCGRYHAIDLQQPTFGFIAVVTDDAPGSGQDTHVQTAVTLAAAEARPASGFHAYATRRTTDAAWTSSAGLTGMTFGQRGVFLSIFLHHGAPVAGVRVTRDASSIPADDFYFSDAGITRSTIDPARTATGPNGSVLAINGPTPITHAGTGGAPAGCEWPSSLAMGIPGVVLVQRKEAQLPGGAPCP